ncbi:hypothetical protein PDIG_02380 [Penicillium digitatum PHI26]|uniref:Uncharacterized protein n=2 Tax=Penicillium digitatum TaxID=36651 RepID=K9GES2_PEND2|nr:hypothetical protein PDIP_13670 [Penicillium digitatum Pd1]EKV19544.1 hypothetical protein PDIG_02380 [Penicillium digitatum PHI26]EKV20720.1 hypothetical protein PDIP_13670 [Penicillium digitatum Pd1]
MKISLYESQHLTRGVQPSQNQHRLNPHRTGDIEPGKGAR